MRFVLPVCAAILGLSIGRVAETQGTPGTPIKIHRIAGIAVLVGNDGVLLVDAQGSPDARFALTALKTVSDKPVRYVINTHCHGDHTGGDAAFQRAGATIVAHDNVRKRLQEGKCGPPAVFPTLTFGNELTLYFDDEVVRIIKLPTGHTDGDAREAVRSHCKLFCLLGAPERF